MTLTTRKFSRPLRYAEDACGAASPDDVTVAVRRRRDFLLVRPGFAFEVHRERDATLVAVGPANDGNEIGVQYRSIRRGAAEVNGVEPDDIEVSVPWAKFQTRLDVAAAELQRQLVAVICVSAGMPAEAATKIRNHLIRFPAVPDRSTGWHLIKTSLRG